MKASQSSILALALLPILIAGARARPDQYVCVVEHAAGLHFDEKVGGWRPRGLGSDGNYTLRRLTEDDARRGDYQLLLKYQPKANWAFFKLGDARPLAACFEADSHFSCKPIVQSLSFDSDSGRFEAVSHGGFIEQGHWEQLLRENPEQLKWMAEHGRANDPSHPNDLVVEIGECSPS
jgi:hypothetical protein